jgi:hypothetical protein
MQKAGLLHRATSGSLSEALISTRRTALGNYEFLRFSNWMEGEK